MLVSRHAVTRALLCAELDDSSLKGALLRSSGGENQQEGGRPQVAHGAVAGLGTAEGIRTEPGTLGMLSRGWVWGHDRLGVGGVRSECKGVLFTPRSKVSDVCQ